MGCGASQDGENADAKSQDTEPTTIQVGPTAVEPQPDEESEHKNKSMKPAVTAVRMTKAAEMLAKKKKEDKEAEEKARKRPTAKKAPPSTIKPEKTSAKPPEKPDVQSSTSPSAVAKPTNNNNTTSGVFGGSMLTASTSAPQSPRQEVPFTEADFVGFTMHKILGKGSFGTTYECALKCCKIVCVKVVEVGDFAACSDELQEIRQEIALMKRFNHPNIVQYYGFLEDTQKKTINIFMEYVTGGSLTSYMKKFPSVPLETARNWTRQMLLGVQYLHSCDVVHRDIKGANILVTNSGELKLADFGCSKSIDDACSKTRGCQSMVGTPYWMAPEVLKSQPYGAKADIWSIGCTVVEMLTGSPPWPEMGNMWAAVYKIANSTGLPPGIPNDLPKPTMRFLERCFERNPTRRASADELLLTDWMKGK